MKVGVFESKLVGATAAYLLVMPDAGQEIVRVDKNTTRAAAEADDLNHAVRFAHPMEVRRAADTVIAGKGATYYGIGCALARIVDAILDDQRSILTVCAPTADVLGVKDVTVALPRLVGGTGEIETFPLPLSEAEQEQRRRHPRGAG